MMRRGAAFKRETSSAVSRFKVPARRRRAGLVFAAMPQKPAPRVRIMELCGAKQPLTSIYVSIHAVISLFRIFTQNPIRP